MANTQGMISLLRDQIKFAHDTLENTVADVSTELATKQPPGLPRTIGSYYAHILIVEDLTVNAILQQKAPLFAAEWRDKTGFDEQAPSDPSMWAGWSSETYGNVVNSRAYAQAVFASTSAYLDGLSDDDLARAIDLSGVGFGVQTTGFVISAFVISNCCWHTGEISCQKGINGYKGYPF